VRRHDSSPAKKAAAKKVPAKKAPAKKAPAKKAAPRKAPAKKAPAKKAPAKKAAPKKAPAKKAAGKKARAEKKAGPTAGAGSLKALPEPPTDPWIILGLTEPVTLAELRRGWRAYASRHHPDQGGDATTFARGHAAYESLIQRLW
jgi:cell wall-associated NlpC family hydrolase